MDKETGLQRLSNYIRDKTAQLFRYRVILIGVLVFAIPIWVLDQGQDLLVNSNSRDMGVILFVSVVIIAAFLNWYLAKLFFEKKYKGPVYPVTEPVLSDPVCQISERKVSRYLGVATIIIPSVAILNAEKVMHVRFPLDVVPPLVWLLVMLSLFFVLIKFDFAGKYYLQGERKWGKRTSTLIAMLLIFLLGFVFPFVIRVVFVAGKSHTPQSLFYLYLDLVFLSFAFYIFVGVRSYIFTKASWLGSKVGWPVILSGGGLALAFILLNAFPLVTLILDKTYLSLPVLLSGIVFYILAVTILIRFSLSKGINFVLLIFLIGLVISITTENDYHDVDMKQVSASPAPIGLTGYFRQWLLARNKEITRADSPYTIYLVNTYGGGIRAAAFTGMVISWLDSVMIRDGRDHKGFEHYVFSVSGASGGTIGAAVQCAYRARYLDWDSTAGTSSANIGSGSNGSIGSSSSRYALDTFMRFYQHDFLTPVLSGMLGRDVWASATSLRLWKDRSEVQENLWEGFGYDALHLGLDTEFNAIWDTGRDNRARYEVPLLFSNTLNVDDGLKGIMAPVKLEHGDFPASVFIRERIDALREQSMSAKDSLRSLSLMTGAFLSARFPFISPSGKMGPGYHFMDGGGKDNSGASTSEDIFISLAKYACSDSTARADTAFTRLMSKVQFCFVSISNSPYYDPDSNRRLVSNRFEPISPLVGIINSGISGNARAADSTLRFRYPSYANRFFAIHAQYCSIWPTTTSIRDDNGEWYSPVLPLGWQISAPSLQRLRGGFADSMIRDYDSIGIGKVLRIARLGKKIEPGSK